METFNRTVQVAALIDLCVTAVESRPMVRRRAGRWVEGDECHYTLSLVARLPTKMIVESPKANSLVSFTRPSDELTAWSVDSDMAAGFQAWVGAFGENALEMVRGELLKADLLTLFRSAANAGAFFGRRPSDYLLSNYPTI